MDLQQKCIRVAVVLTVLLDPPFVADRCGVAKLGLEHEVADCRSIS
jgi:hypothetical protein